MQTVHKLKLCAATMDAKQNMLAGLNTGCINYLSCTHGTSKVQHTSHVWNRTCDYLSNSIEGRHAKTKDEDDDRHLAYAASFMDAPS